MTHYENRADREFMERCIAETMTLQRQVTLYQVNEYVFVLNVYSGVLNKVMRDLEAIYRAHHPYNETEPPVFLPTHMIPPMHVTEIPTAVMNHASMIQDSLGTSGYAEEEEQSIWSDMDTWMNIIEEEDGLTDGEDEDEELDYQFIVRSLESEFNDLPHIISQSDMDDLNVSSVFDDMDVEFDFAYPTLQDKVLPENSLSPDVCGICLDAHYKLESVACTCLHEFGQECFQGWMNVCRNNKQKITCPCCRADVLDLYAFVVV